MLKEPSDKQGTVSALETTGSSLSSSLLTRLQCRDGDAFQRLVELYGPVVYGWCRRRGLQPADAADLGQEVFASVAQRIADFRRDRPSDSFRAWLWGIARHKLLDHWRGRERRPVAVGGSEAQAQLAQVAQDEDVSVPEGPPVGTRGLCCIARWSWSAWSLRTAPGKRSGGSRWRGRRWRTWLGI